MESFLRNLLVQVSTRPTDEYIQSMIASEQAEWEKPKSEHLKALALKANAQALEQFRSMSLKDAWMQFFSSDRTTKPSSPLSCVAAKLLEDQFKTDKVIVELGCGIGKDLSYLLGRGSKVTAVDMMPVASFVNGRFAEQIKTGELTLVQAKMEEFSFPKDVRLVFANDALPYCEPNKWISLLSKIYEALMPCGCFVGNFIEKPHPAIAAMQRGLIKTSYVACDQFASGYIVRKMLVDVGFKILICKVNAREANYIDFVAQKPGI